MRIGKSLLLGSAAGIAAVAGAQAADLPVKAKPVEYVKVCSLYGAGFFYIPGTDKCIKIGGLLREQWDIHGAGDEQAYFNTTSGTWTRGFTNNSSFRTRSVITVDVREQSSFGTIRAYTAFGAQQTTPNDANSALFFTRSFVQFAGFTGGRAVSFFDFISYDPYGYLQRPSQPRQHRRHRHRRVCLYGAVRQRRVGHGLGGRQLRANRGAAAPLRLARLLRGQHQRLPALLAPGVRDVLPPRATTIPDIVGSLRVDQAWGSAQIMGAYHRGGGELLRLRGRRRPACRTTAIRAIRPAGRRAPASCSRTSSA